MMLLLLDSEITINSAIINPLSPSEHRSKTNSSSRDFSNFRQVTHYNHHVSDESLISNRIDH